MSHLNNVNNENSMNTSNTPDSMNNTNPVNNLNNHDTMNTINEANNSNNPNIMNTTNQVNNLNPQIMKATNSVNHSNENTMSTTNQVNKANPNTVSSTNTTKKPGIRKLYNCTQGQLYIICFLAWQYYLEYLDGFSKYRGAFTQQYGDDAVAAVTAAKALKNIKARNQVTSTNRNKTSAAATQMCWNWQVLKDFIKKAYEGDDVETNLEAAGSAYYTPASRKDWNEMEKLITCSTEFITAHNDELTKGNNMPADFAKKFTDDAKTCSDLIKTFLGSTIVKKGQTTTKQEANNAIYTTLISMLESGQKAYKDNKAVKDMFIFNTLYKAAKSKSPASLKGYIYSNGKPLPGATVTIQKTNLKGITNKYGYFNIGRVNAEAEDMYWVDITKDEFVPGQQAIGFKAGTAKHIKVTLQPVAMHSVENVGQATGNVGQATNIGKAI